MDKIVKEVVLWSGLESCPATMCFDEETQEYYWAIEDDYISSKSYRTIEAAETHLNFLGITAIVVLSDYNK